MALGAPSPEHDDDPVAMPDWLFLMVVLTIVVVVANCIVTGLLIAGAY